MVKPCVCCVIFWLCIIAYRNNYFVTYDRDNYSLSYEVHKLVRCINMQVIYIAPLKAIVRERMSDWQKRLVSQLGKKMVPIFAL